jgi:hypothetical protein
MIRGALAALACLLLAGTVIIAAATTPQTGSVPNPHPGVGPTVGPTAGR